MHISWTWTSCLDFHSQEGRQRSTTHAKYRWILTIKKVMTYSIFISCKSNLQVENPQLLHYSDFLINFVGSYHFCFYIVVPQFPSFPPRQLDLTWSLYYSASLKRQSLNLSSSLIKTITLFCNLISHLGLYFVIPTKITRLKIQWTI